MIAIGTKGHSQRNAVVFGGCSAAHLLHSIPFHTNLNNSFQLHACNKYFEF